MSTLPNATDGPPGGPVDSWAPAFCWSLLISTGSLVLLTAGLLAIRMPLNLFAPALLKPSITSCVLTPDGRHALVTCRLRNANGEAACISLVSIDLSGKVPRAKRLPPNFRNHALVSLGQDGVALAANTQWIERRCIVSGDDLPVARVGHARPPEFVTTSCDGRWLVTAEGNLRVINLLTNRVRWQRDHLPVTSIAIAPGGRLICVLNEGEIVEYSLESPETERTVLRTSGELFSIAIDPQGLRLACLYTTGKIEMRTLQDGRLLWSRAAHGLVAFSHQHRAELVSRVLSFSPDGRDLVTATSEEAWMLAVWDVRSGERVQALRGHDELINGVAYLADGTLVSWSFDGTLRFWDVPHGFARRIVSLEELLSC